MVVQAPAQAVKAPETTGIFGVPGDPKLPQREIDAAYRLLSDVGLDRVMTKQQFEARLATALMDGSINKNDLANVLGIPNLFGMGITNSAYDAFCEGNGTGKLATVRDLVASLEDFKKYSENTGITLSYFVQCSVTLVESGSYGEQLKATVGRMTEEQQKIFFKNNGDFIANSLNQINRNKAYFRAYTTGDNMSNPVRADDIADLSDYEADWLAQLIFNREFKKITDPQQQGRPHIFDDIKMDDVLVARYYGEKYFTQHLLTGESITSDGIDDLRDFSDRVVILKSVLGDRADILTAGVSPLDPSLDTAMLEAEKPQPDIAAIERLLTFARGGSFGTPAGGGDMPNEGSAAVVLPPVTSSRTIVDPAYSGNGFYALTAVGRRNFSPQL